MARSLTTIFLAVALALLLWWQGADAAGQESPLSHDVAEKTGYQFHSAENSPLRRELPAKVIVGYTTQCNDQVVTAVKQGVNVVIWAFYHLSPGNHVNQEDSELHKVDLACIQAMIQDLDEQGFTDTVHLVSMGGWNGPHLDPYFTSSSQWFDAWKAMVGHVFHGIDIDFEGDDDLTSDRNYLQVPELDLVGGILELAKQNGYITTMAPAQSYLDIHSQRFSRFLNTTGSWHADFSYFGQNLYAYWLAKYGESIDLVMIQFYESWSRASMEINQNHVTPENYLQQYVWDMNQFKQGPGLVVNFGSDPEVGLPDHQYIAFPLSKLVWGFANAWANTGDERHIYFPPECVQAGYQNLWDWMLEPRGMMFWDIGDEGQQGIYYARGLNEILHIRSSSSSEIVDNEYA